MAAFTSAVTAKGVMGSRKLRMGTFASSAGATGGDIETGLRFVNFIRLQGGGDTAYTGVPVIIDTLPRESDGDITIVTDANATGFWYAVGK